jgi:hypothetical protein
VAGHPIEDERFQLSHVARKAVGLEQLVERQGHRRHPLAELARRLLDEMIDQKGNIAADQERQGLSAFRLRRGGRWTWWVRSR